MKYLTPTDRYDIEDFNNNFREIEDRINELEDSYPSLKTPQEVYEETRPSDWLPMPMPNDDEMYLLFHIPNGLSELIAFTVTCTGNYTVETGTVVNGAFVSQTSANFASSSKYEAELFADDYGDLTSNGFKQVMIKVSGTEIKIWRPSAHNKKTVPANFYSWNIVEVACKLPQATSVVFGHGTIVSALKNLYYAAIYGETLITNCNAMFQNCFQLITVLSINTSKATTMQSMFTRCLALKSIPLMDTSQVTTMYQFLYDCSKISSIPPMDTRLVTNMGYMFYGCTGLKRVPPLNTSNLLSANRMFNSCRALSSIPMMDTSKVKNMESMFSGCYVLRALPISSTSEVTTMKEMCAYCYSLAKIPSMDMSKVENLYQTFYRCYPLKVVDAINISKVTNMNEMVTDCNNLSSIKLDPTVTGWAGAAISLANASLSHQAIIDFFNSLPTITSSKAITLTGNPGVPDLTDTDKAIATQKGWTLTL